MWVLTAEPFEQQQFGTSGIDWVNMVAVRFGLLVPAKQFVMKTGFSSSHVIDWEDHLPGVSWNAKLHCHLFPCYLTFQLMVRNSAAM